MLLLLSLLTAAHAACDTPTTTSDLNAALSSAEGAYAGMDEAAFAVARDRAAAILPCLGEPLTPVEAGAWHRVRALDGYLAQDDQQVIAAFRSAIVAQPGRDLSSSVAPGGNPLRTLFDSARKAGPGPGVAVKAPAGTSLTLDGASRPERPTERPALAQLQAANGQILWIGELSVGAPLPDWGAMISPSPSPVAGATSAPTGPSKQKNSSSRRRPLLVASGVGAVAAGALYATAYGMGKNYDDIHNTDVKTTDDLDSLRTRTNALVWTSAGTFGVSATLGAVALLSSSALRVGFQW